MPTVLTLLPEGASVLRRMAVGIINHWTVLVMTVFVPVLSVCLGNGEEHILKRAEPSKGDEEDLGMLQISPAVPRVGYGVPRAVLSNLFSLSGSYIKQQHGADRDAACASFSMRQLGTSFFPLSRCCEPRGIKPMSLSGGSNEPRAKFTLCFLRFYPFF